MDPESGWARKPEDELRHWSTYASPGDYWADYGGYVPIQVMHVISQAMRRLGLTFVAAYALMLERGAIVELDTARRATQLAQPPSNITVTAGKGAPMASAPRGTSERNARMTANETTPTQARQGDVLLVPVKEIPNGVKRVKRDRGRAILAYGEVTGHAHAITSPSATLLAAGGDRYLRVAAPVTLSHEEHGAIAIAPGTYRVVIQREYVPSELSSAGFRRVID